MKRSILYSLLTLAICFCASCSSDKVSSNAESAAVDLSPIFAADNIQVLDSMIAETKEELGLGTFHFMSKTDFKYAGECPTGSSPFLSVAEDYYNTFAIANAFTSDFELLMRNLQNLENHKSGTIDKQLQGFIEVSQGDSIKAAEYLESKEGKDFVKFYMEEMILPQYENLPFDSLFHYCSQISCDDLIKADSIKDEVERLKDSALTSFDGGEYDGWMDFPDYMAYGMLNLSNYISYSYEELGTAFSDRRSAFDAVCDSLKTIVCNANNVIADSMMAYIHYMPEVKTYEEQCALAELAANNLNWHNLDSCSILIAIFDEMISSRKYNDWNVQLWQYWRCLLQKQFFGESKDSAIPNDLYNYKREICFETYLKHIASHPDDVVAINNASVLANTANIRRYGQYLYGNQVSLDAISLFPKLADY